MENKSDDFLGNIYTSYGPMIGKACENTNMLLNTNNIESLTSSVVESFKSNKISQEPLLEIKNKTVKIMYDKQLNNDNLNIQTEIINNDIIDTNTSYSLSSILNYKVSIFNYEISIWIFILIIIIILCIIYFIYKYCYLSNNFIFYKKKSSNDNLDTVNTNTKNNKTESFELNNSNSNISSNTSSDTSSHTSSSTNDTLSQKTTTTSKTITNISKK